MVECKIHNLAKHGAVEQTRELKSDTSVSELERLRAEKEALLDTLESRTAEVQALRRANALLAADGADAWVDDVVAGLRELLPVQAARLVVRTEQGALEVVALAGSGLERPQSPIPPEGLTGWVLEQNAAQIVHDPYHDNRFQAEVDVPAGLEPQSLLCVPVRRGSTCLGVLQAYNAAAPHLFGARDVLVAEVLAGAAAVLLSRKVALPGQEKVKS